MDRGNRSHTRTQERHTAGRTSLATRGLALAEAGDAARVRHSPGGEPGGTVAVEPGVSDEVVAKPRRRDHRVGRAGGGMGGYQAILIHPETGMLHGGTDVHKDGQVVGH